MKISITDANIITSYGLGIDLTWNGLLAGKTAIDKNSRFATQNLLSDYAALVPDLTVTSEKTLIMQMLEKLVENRKVSLTEDAYLILATTTGEIDLLEKAVLDKHCSNINQSDVGQLLKKVNNLFHVDTGMLMSAACASSTAAVAHAANLIKEGKKECVVVVGCDCVSEFVASGFSSLQATGVEPARPFDRNRDGLTVGEAAGYIVLMNEARAMNMKLPCYGYIAGWGMSNDANHMTGPSRDGAGLAISIKKAIMSAGLSSKEIGSICAHGTGTVYNDSMEMKAFKSTFSKPVPTYSIKGGIGHTMGAAGIIEIITAGKSLREQTVPPTVGLIEPDEEAEGWVYKKPEDSNSEYCLSVNAGFGGINTAVIIKKATA